MCQSKIVSEKYQISRIIMVITLEFRRREYWEFKSSEISSNSSVPEPLLERYSGLKNIKNS